MRHFFFVLFLVSFLVAPPASAGDGPLLVACAPGYPGSTEQAQPTMDAFAAAVTERSGWEAGGLSAVYHEEEDAGLAALAGSRAVLALVPLPFYLEHRRELELEPLLEVLPESGEAEVWSLVAKKGTLRGPAGLSGWDLAGVPGYAPGFVRNVALAGWGELPGDVRIRFSARALSELRKAAAGEPVAVLLDGAQAGAMPSLPFAADLEVVARSPVLAGNLLCRVGGRLPAAAVAEVKGALLAMNEDEPGRGVLASLRLAGFREADARALREVQDAFAGGDAP